MHAFFNPVEVIKKHHLQYPQQKLHKFQLFQMTQPLIISLAEERKQLKHWLQTLTLPQRRYAASIHSPEFVCLIRRLFQEMSRLNGGHSYKYVFIIKQGEYMVCRQTCYFLRPSPSQDLLLQSVLLISQSQLFQACTLSDQILSDPENLVKLIDDIQGADPLIVYDLNHFTSQELASGKVMFDKQIQQGEPKTLGNWIAELIFKQISLCFVSKSVQGERWSEDIRMQQMEYNKLWRSVSSEQREGIVLKGLSKSFADIMEDYRYSVAISSNQFPILYNQAGGKEQFIKQMLNCNPKSLYRHLIYTSLASSLQIYNMYKVSILLQIQAKLAIQKQPSQQQNKKKKRKKKINEVDVGSERMAKVEKEQAKMERKENEVQTQMEQMKLLESKVEKTIINTNIQKQKPIIYKEQTMQLCREQNLVKTNQSISAQTMLISDQQKRVTLKAIDKPPSHSKNQQIQQRNGKLQNQRDLQLQNYYKLLMQQNRDKLRKIVYHRLLFIFSRLQINCRVFGSYANHLSLADSDLDIMIDSAILSYFYTETHPPKIQVVAALNYILKILQQQPWASDFLLLPNARIPLLIFKADAGVYFALENNQKSKLKLNGKNIKEGMIQVDLSIQPFSNVQNLVHKGLQTTQMIRSWTDQHPLFSKLLIIIKALAKKLLLHKSYQGGVSSYTLALLVVVFLRSNLHLQTLEYAMVTFSLFLKDMYEGFWVIDLVRGISKENHQKAGVINPCDGVNLLQRSFRLGELIKGMDRWEQLIVN